MLDKDTRTAILSLRKKGHGIRSIARALQVSRRAVKAVLDSGTAEVPTLERAEKGIEHLDEIRRLYASCRGNLVRVHEELEAQGIEIPYSSLTGLCRRHKVGVKPKKPAGRYHFEPSEEMQHDTSPHDVKVGGKWRKLQCASVVMCYSRMRYVQIYPHWDRFQVKVFLTEAIEYFGGAADRCMLDNSTVIMIKGTGKDAVPAPEMAAFSERFGFEFVAHERGDANRSAHVECRFWHVEGNFYAGRTFSDLNDLNQQARAWCERMNHKYRKSLKAKPIELFAAERPHLKPLPVHIPQVYRLHQRMVDVEGYVHVHSNRYSAPWDLIGRRVEVRETKDHIRIFNGHKEAALHAKRERGAQQRSTLDEHRYDGRWRKERRPKPAAQEEKELRAASDTLGRMVDRLRKGMGGRCGHAVRRLHRMFIDYPAQPLVDAVEQALKFGLTDLARIEKMALKNIAGDYFRLLPTRNNEDNDNG